MKMVQGRSLGQILDELRDRPRSGERHWPLSRLLNIFVSVCHALAYAHSRQVIHRDLKPANIMVGDFGEVYVMDWGLAKVVGKERSQSDSPSIGAAVEAIVDWTQHTSGPSQVVTSREMDGELTQDGAILGTPAYMSPEQARGEVHTLDERSDIYSLGAMLYELLTLAAPIDKQGGAMGMLIRVVEGKIAPPAERAPQRDKQGKIPKELAAIAMKALSNQPADRYRTAESLRQDVERFQEGRSVSAKHDSPWEQAAKFVKRNKGLSAATGTALLVLAVVLAVAFQINYAARVQAEEARAKSDQHYAEYQQEQKAKETVIKRSIPALVRAGVQLANEGRIQEAADQVMLALTYDPNDPDARLLNGQILASKQNWAAARRELEAHLQARPKSLAGRTLLEKIADDGEKDIRQLYAIAETLQQQQLTGLSIPLLEKVQKDAALRQPTVMLYRKQVEAAWPGMGGALTLAKDGQIVFAPDTHAKRVTDLSPLRGMKLDVVDLDNCTQIRDLAPLKGMPLTRLFLQDCKLVEDLSPLRGMKLERLHLFRTGIRDLAPLEGMPLTYLNLSYDRISDLRPLRGMPLQVLNLHACQAVQDLSPLAGMELLTELDIGGCSVKDLSPLQGMPLKKLDINVNPKIDSLATLAGMPLEKLFTANTAVSDISPLRGMPLQELSLSTKVADLTPLEGMQLKRITFYVRSSKLGIEVLREMDTLTLLRPMSGTGAAYTPDDFWRRYDAGEFSK